jgi:hypothetical protein
MLLNVALVILSALGAIVAFGGKSWHGGARPLVERITPRGYVTLACILLTLVVAISKAYQDHLSDEQHRRDAQLDRQRLKDTKDLLATKSAQLQQLETGNLAITISQGHYIVGSHVWLESSQPGPVGIGHLLFDFMRPDERQFLYTTISFQPYHIYDLSFKCVFNECEQVDEGKVGSPTGILKFESNGMLLATFWSSIRSPVHSENAAIVFQDWSYGRPVVKFSIRLLYKPSSPNALVVFLRSHGYAYASLQKLPNNGGYYLPIRHDYEQELTSAVKRLNHRSFGALEMIAEGGKADAPIQIQDLISCGKVTFSPNELAFNCQTSEKPAVVIPNKGSVSANSSLSPNSLV